MLKEWFKAEGSLDVIKSPILSLRIAMKKAEIIALDSMGIAEVFEFISGVEFHTLTAKSF